MLIQVPEETASLGRKKYKSTKRHPSFWKNAHEYFSEYTSTTSLHGFQYMGEQKRSKFERCLWLIIISVSLGICIFFISKSYRKWNATPVIVSFAHSPMPVWKVPFPAITICPETKWRQNVYNFTKYYHLYENNRTNLTDSDFKSLGDASLLCQFSVDGNITTNEDVFEFMELVSIGMAVKAFHMDSSHKRTSHMKPTLWAAPSKEEVILSCSSPTLGSQCTTMFSTVITEEGICYSFNTLDRDDIYRSEVYHSTNFQNHQENVSDWSSEKGYTKSARANAYPRRTASAGAEGGLTLLLMAFNKDLDYLCRGPIQGFKVLLHHPGEVPRVSMQYFRVPFDEDVTVAVKPDVVKTSNSLRNYDPHKRGCYFSDEKQLRYYKNYTQQNCLMECLTNYTLKMCDCVSFYMPRRNTTNICGSGSTSCVNKAKRDALVGNVTNDFDVDCDCLPSCTTLMYNSETSQSTFEWRTFLKILIPGIDPSTLVGSKISSVSIFFKEMQFITSERNELYGITDFLANCGGLLGLFIGFSLLSLLETLYFLTIRLGINWRKYGRHYWSGSDYLLQNEMYGYEKQSV